MLDRGARHLSRSISRRLIAIGAVCFTSCVHGPPAYDPITYKSLTDLKPEVILLYESFSAATLNEQAIAGTRLRLAQIFEYEHDKGTENAATEKDIVAIRSEFDRTVAGRAKKGPWSPTFLEDKKENITRIIDLAIRNERLKNSNR